MNHTTPVVANQRDDKSWQWDESAPGDFFISAEGTQIQFMCPCGCGAERILSIGTSKPAQGPSWQWDGNRERPTLSPSIRDISHCKWHGYLRAGVFEPCGDSGR